jgi:hypothetical protein
MTTTAGPASAQLPAPAFRDSGAGGMAVGPADGSAVSPAASPAVVEAVDATVADIVRALGKVESIIRTATAWRTELLDAARRAVELVPGSMLAPRLAPDTMPTSSSSDDAALAQRALVADVATTLAVHERTAARLVEEAEVLVGGLPTTVAGMRSGRVSYRHAQALVEHTADLDPSDRAAIETAVLPAAASTPPGAFARRVARARERMLAEPVTVRHERAASRRNVRVDPARDGMAFLTAYLPAATACAVGDRLDRAVGLLRGPDEPRTADQLRADVLSALLLDDGTLDHEILGAGPDRCPTPSDRHTEPDGRVVPDGGDEAATAPGAAAVPSARQIVERVFALPFDPDDSPARLAAARAAMARLVRGITPHVTVTVPALTLLRTLESHDDPAETGPDADPPENASGPPGKGASHHDPDPPLDRRGARAAPDDGSVRPSVRPETAYLDGYGPIDDVTATLLAARAPSFRRLLTHPHTGAALAVGRETYIVPADLRAFLRLRDETCRFPGCSRRAGRCDVDHTVAYVCGGTTDATNLAHLCRTHHRLKHGTRWDVRHVGTDGSLTWTAPSGHEHTTRPAVAVAVAVDDLPPF